MSSTKTENANKGKLKMEESFVIFNTSFSFKQNPITGKYDVQVHR